MASEPIPGVIPGTDITVDEGGGTTVTSEVQYIEEIQGTDGTVYTIKDKNALNSITSSDVTTALGYTPYNSSNPNGYITSSYHDTTKQDVISDLSTIRSGAEAGSTALQPSALDDYTPTDDLGMMAFADKVTNGDIDGTIDQDKITNLATTLSGKYDASNPNGYTSNTGTITGITMNGASKGTSGVVDLGTVITEHQSLKTINNESIVGSGNISISGGAEVVYFTTANTYNDIKTAYEAGKLCYFRPDGSSVSAIYQLAYVYATGGTQLIIFTRADSDYANNYYQVNSSNTWTHGTYYMQYKLSATQLSATNAPYLKTPYVSGTSGYRIWSDGYCEQWGRYTPSGSGAATTFTVSFSKTMANTNYTPICNYGAGSNNQYGQCYSLTTSGMTIKGYKGNDHSWRVFGYLASGQY